MAKEGKKPIGKIVLGVIVVLVIVGAVGSMGGNSTDSPASDSAKPAGTTQQAEEQKEPQEPYTIADEAEDTSNQFAYKITGCLLYTSAIWMRLFHWAATARRSSWARRRALSARDLASSSRRCV